MVCIPAHLVEIQEQGAIKAGWLSGNSKIKNSSKCAINSDLGSRFLYWVNFALNACLGAAAQRAAAAAPLRLPILAYKYFFYVHYLPRLQFPTSISLVY